ncbi:MAG TPA: glutathione S-transferase family protein [Myxococcota bacterium]|nr:glutathione S-transferase family protein [Myxococcota bacterium]
MSLPHLILGNKNYSSWSMRPWLALRWGRITFAETVIPLGGPGYGKSQIPEILAVSPSGRVPVLMVGDLRIWDSLAICEWAAEQSPALWPADAAARATARSAAAEMHAGFPAVRRDLSMNLRRRSAARDWPADTKADLTRIHELWTELLRASGGPFLFGEKCIADAMFAPVCTRLRSYGVPLSGPVAAYCEAIFTDPDFLDWEHAALAEPWRIASTDDL